jgi:hypothetical protein
LADYILPEQTMGSTSRLDPQDFIASSQRVAGSVGSLYQEYDLDSFTLFFERESRQAAMAQNAPAAPPVEAARIQVPVIRSADFVAYSEMFEHEHDSHTILDQYANGQSSNNRPLVVWGDETQFAHVCALLTPHVEREVIAGDAFTANGARHSRSYDAFLLATDPRELILDLRRYKLLAPRVDGSELVIWIHGNDHSQMQYRRWLPSVKLARRLLGASGWQVSVESQTDLR